MDAQIGLVKKLNDLAWQAALKRQDAATGFIYFDEKKPYDQETKLIPFVENLAFVLTLFNLKNQEAFLKAEKQLSHLLFYHDSGTFPKYLHEVPIKSSPYIGLLCYPYLMKMRLNYKTYLNKALLVQIEGVMSSIKEASKLLEIYHHLKPLYQAIHAEPVEALFLSYESALACSLLECDQMPDMTHQEVKFTEHGHLMLSCFDFIKAQNEQNYPHYLVQDHPLHLKLSLFYEPFEKKSYPKQLFDSKTFSKGFVWQCSKGDQHVISFDETQHQVYERTIELSGHLELHADFHIYLPYKMELTQWGKKGTYFIKNEVIHIVGHDQIVLVRSSVNLSIGYQKPKIELFDTEGLYLRVSSSGPFKIHLERID